MIVTPDRTRWLLDLCKGHQSPVAALIHAGRKAGEPRRRQVFAKTDPTDLIKRAAEA